MTLLQKTFYRVATDGSLLISCTAVPQGIIMFGTGAVFDLNTARSLRDFLNIVLGEDDE